MLPVQCTCVRARVCILVYVLYNLSNKLYSGFISQILCKASYARSCLLTASLFVYLSLSLSLSIHVVRGAYIKPFLCCPLNLERDISALETCVRF